MVPIGNLVKLNNVNIEKVSQFDFLGVVINSTAELNLLYKKPTLNHSTSIVYRPGYFTVHPPGSKWTKIF